MDVQALLKRVAEQRETWVDLGEGKRLKFTRPPEVEMPQFIRGITVEHVVKYARGWDGFSEADFVGAALGSSDPLEFNAELWETYIKDNTKHLKAIVTAMRDAVTVFLEQRGAITKNSPPSSTQPAPSSRATDGQQQTNATS